MSFSDLGLSDELLRAVADAGYDTPTPIQEKAIPFVLMGRDILGCAQTGTGKTASFTLPMLDILATGQAKARMPRSLILEPTRELAAQVADNFDTYGKYQRLSKALLIGGESMNDQIKAMDSGVDVLIATPGRLIDLFERGQLLLNDVKVLVIDEADRMLDMGFIPDVERIVSKLPKMRTTLMFSATMPKEIRRLADAFLMNPKEITVEAPSSSASTITQGLVQLPVGASSKDKRNVLRALIEKDNPRNAIIFCNRKRDVDIVCKSLKKHGYEAGQLHGDMSQPARMETLDLFKADGIRLLVCSDVAARGLDIPAMSHVFNFDVPTHPEDYVHRIGRTGRAGKQGHAYTLALKEDKKYVDGIERMSKQPIPLVAFDGLGVEIVGETGSSRDRNQDGNRNRNSRNPRKPRNEPRNENRSEPKVEPKVEAKVEAKSEPKVESEIKPLFSPKAVPEVEAKPVQGPPMPPALAEKVVAEQTQAVVEATVEAQPAEVKTDLPPAPPHEPRQQQNRNNRNNNNSNKRGRRPSPQDEVGSMPDVVVKGMGDLTPAFLMHPIPLSKALASNDDGEDASVEIEAGVDVEAEEKPKAKRKAPARKRAPRKAAVAEDVTESAVVAETVETTDSPVVEASETPVVAEAPPVEAVAEETPAVEADVKADAEEKPKKKAPVKRRRAPAKKKVEAVEVVAETASEAAAPATEASSEAESTETTEKASPAVA